MMMVNISPGEVVDLFCGIGGASHGFYRAGFDIRAGYDFDDSCKFGYEYNNSSKFITADINNLEADEIKSQFSGTLPTCIIGCAPCQAFSALTKNNIVADERINLPAKMVKLILEVLPDVLMIENVQRFLTYQNREIFNEVIKNLSTEYHCTYKVINCVDFGVPQKRKRLIIIGSRNKEISLDRHVPHSVKTVADTIKGLPSLKHGEIDSTDSLHRCSSLSELNLERIRCSKPGGTWEDWPNHLVTQCHKRVSSYKDVYARMEWEKPSPTLTTHCTGFGNGRFGHPEQDRAISLREAALLQSFPADFCFYANGEFSSFQKISRQIGNSVPPLVAEEIANIIA